MGIRFLTSYMEWYYDGKWKKVTLTGPLVLDALSICYTIYGMYGIDWLHGGQYWELRSHFKMFFNSLTDSGIEPIVVFDGIDFTGDKSSVIKRRKEATAQCIADALLHSSKDQSDDSGDFFTSSKTGVIPLFAEKVFTETLLELNIPFLYADGDADWDSVSIANHHRCPLVSNDSDYFIFNLEAGYIPFNKFYWRNKPVTAKLYRLVDFAASFSFPSLDLSLLIPTIMGNDYITALQSPALRGDIAVCLLDLRDSRGGTRKGIDKTHELIHYLSSFRSVDEFMTHVARISHGDELSLITKNYEKAKGMYRVKHLTEADLMSKTDLRTANGTPLPMWILLQYRKGLLSTSVMLPLVLNGCMLPIVIDDPKRESSLVIGRHLRSCMYRILGPYLKEKVREQLMTFSHWTTEKVEMAEESLGLPSIENMERLTVSEKIEALCTAMECSSSILDSFDAEWIQWKLVTLTLCFWAVKACPKLHLIKSLVLCFVVCSLDEDPYLAIPPEAQDYRGSKRWLDSLHTFSMWQCVYYEAIKLNSVLMNPLYVRTPALLFDGKLAMSYASFKDLDSFIQRMLSSLSKEASCLFEALMSTINLHLSFHLSFHPPAKCKSKDKDKTTTYKIGRPQKVKDLPTVSTTNRFNVLSLPDNDEDSDQ